MADFSDDGPIKITELEERQRLKVVEDRIIDLQVVLESTLDTISALQAAYTQLMGSNYDTITIALKEKYREATGYMMKVEALQRKAQGTSQLVCHQSSSEP